MTLAADEQHRLVHRERRDREVVGSCVARGYRGRRRGTGGERDEHRWFGNTGARGRERSQTISEKWGSVGMRLGRRVCGSCGLAQADWTTMGTVECRV